MLTVTRPAIQPHANAGPAVRALGDPRISTTPTIGIGLSATASAAGSRSPIASFNTPGILSAPVDGRLFRPDSPQPMGDVGLEPTTLRLRVSCSTN